MEEKIRSLVNKYSIDGVSYRKIDQIFAKDTLVLATVEIENPSPFWTYYGPRMFQTTVLPLRLVNLTNEFIEKYGRFTTHFYSQTDYRPPLIVYKIEYVADRSVVKAWKHLPASVPSYSVDLIDMLPQFIMEAYLEAKGVKAKDVLDYNLDETPWSMVLGILEEEHDTSKEP